MTDHHHNPHDEPAKDKGWADNPKTVQMIWYGLIAICAVLFVADFFYEKHPYFPIETLPNFYGVYGFVGCVFLVLAAAQLRKLLMRPENYYEKKDAAYETKNLGQSSADKDAPDAPYEGHPHYEAEKAGKGH